MNAAACAAPSLAYTQALSETNAVPRIRERGFFVPALGEFRLSFAMGDEELEITNTGPGFICAESESPALKKGGFSLKQMEVHHGQQ